MKKRKGVITSEGRPMTLIGPERKVGHKAPDYRLLATNMTEVTPLHSNGKVRLLSVVGSLETSVCDLQTQRFESEMDLFPDLVAYTISMDLPFAQARYADAHEIGNMKLLSDYRDASFGMAYGVLIEETRLLSRSVFVIDRHNIIRYVQYVKEITQEPDYEAAISALKELTLVVSAVA